MGTYIGTYICMYMNEVPMQVSLYICCTNWTLRRVSDSHWARTQAHFSPSPSSRPIVVIEFKLFGSFRKSFSHQIPHVAYFVAHLFIAFVFYDHLLFCSYFVWFLFGLFNLSALAI